MHHVASNLDQSHDDDDILSTIFQLSIPANKPKFWQATCNLVLLNVIETKRAIDSFITCVSNEILSEIVQRDRQYSLKYIDRKNVFLKLKHSSDSNMRVYSGERQKFYVTMKAIDCLRLITQQSYKSVTHQRILEASRANIIDTLKSLHRVIFFILEFLVLNNHFF